MLKKHNKHGPLKWFAGVLAAASLLTALPYASPVYAAGDTGNSSGVQTSYTGFSAVSDIKVNNVSVKRYGHYSLRFFGNGNTGGSMTNYTDAELDKKISLKNGYTRTGYTFVDWDTASDGSGTNYEESLTATADTFKAEDGSTVNLYAQWKPHTYTVHYDAGYPRGSGKETGSMADQTMTYDQTAVLTNNAFTKAGYQLTGWKGSDGKTYSNMDLVRNLTSKDGAVITLTGQWTEATDATGLIIDANDHKHIAVEKYNADYHWNECSVCGKFLIQKEDGTWIEDPDAKDLTEKTLSSASDSWKQAHKHNFTTNYWSAGSADYCADTNHHHFICSCGYEKIDDTGRAAHTPEITQGKNGWSYTNSVHYTDCKVCGETLNTELHYYHDASGKKVTLTEDMKGIQCEACGWKSPGCHQSLLSYIIYPQMSSDEIKCRNNTAIKDYSTDKYGKPSWSGSLGPLDGYVVDGASVKTSNVKISGRTIEMDVSMNFPKGWKVGLNQQHKDQENAIESKYASVYVSRPSAFTKGWPTEVESASATVTSGSPNASDGLTSASWHVKSTGAANDDGGWYRLAFCLQAEDPDGNRIDEIEARFMLPDNFAAPVVTSAKAADTSGWTTQPVLTISGTDSYSHTVHLTVKDELGRTVVENESVPVSGGKWTWTGHPVTEASASGTKFYATVTNDSGWTCDPYEFTMSKIDNQAPMIKSVKVKDIPSGGDYVQVKEVTITVLEEGSGGTQIGINQMSDMKGENDLDPSGKPYVTRNGAEYTRTYRFTGDKYDDDDWSIFVKDAAGNETEQKLPIGRIDGTAPRIGTVDINGLAVTVHASDLNNKLNREGSGVKRYGYLNVASDSSIAKWSTSASFTLPKAGTYLIFAEDAVGNRSEVYQVTVGASSGAKNSRFVIFDTDGDAFYKDGSKAPSEWND